MSRFEHRNELAAHVANLAREISEKTGTTPDVVILGEAFVPWLRFHGFRPTQSQIMGGLPTISWGRLGGVEVMTSDVPDGDADEDHGFRIV